MSEDPEGADDQVEWDGNKYYTSMQVTGVREQPALIELFDAEDGSDSCNGDSGGGAFMQLADGSWRLFGVLSFGLLTYEDIVPGAPICGVGSAYGVVGSELAWVESVIGEDISPCWSDEGEVEPRPGCGRFPMELDQSAGAWATGCVGEVGGEIPWCGPEPEPESEPEPDVADDLGCSVSESEGPFGVVGLALVLMFRRRVRHASVACGRPLPT